MLANTRHSSPHHVRKLLEDAAKLHDRGLYIVQRLRAAGVVDILGRRRRELLLHERTARARRPVRCP